MTTGPAAGEAAGSSPGPAAGGSADLIIDTALLRRVAEMVDHAAEALRGDGTCEVFRSPLSDASLGPSAAGREVAVAAGRRVTEAVDAARALALRVARAAEKIRAAAEQFERAEAGQIPGPR